MCEDKEMKYWYEKCVTRRDDKVVVKLYDGENRFLTSAIIPTVTYPLNGEVEVFNAENTAICEDETILSCFDTTEYKIGFCYDNTDRLVKELKKAGVDAVPYCGWLFTGATYPVHHAWVVVNGNSVLDLCDEFWALYEEDGNILTQHATKEDNAKLLAEFHIKHENEANRDRCYPVGTPTEFLCYVGCPCEPNEGRKIYQALMRSFPDHECQRNCGVDGANETQRIIAESGAKNAKSLREKMRKK